MNKLETFHHLREQYQNLEPASKRAETSGIPDLDHVLKGGWTPGINLIKGAPGIGKSLICALTAENVLRSGPVLIADTDNSYQVWRRHLPLLRQKAFAIDTTTSNRYGLSTATFAGILDAIQVATSQKNIAPRLVIIETLDTITSTDNREQRSQELHQFLFRLDRLSKKRHLPILATLHDYQQQDSSFYDPSYDANRAEDTNYHHLDDIAQDQKMLISQHATSSTTIGSAELDPDNPLVSVNESFISMGRTIDSLRTPHGETMRKVDFDDARRGGLADGFYMMVAHQSKKSEASKLIQIPFSFFSDFQPHTPPPIFRDLHTLKFPEYDQSGNKTQSLLSPYTEHEC
jgi:hypothetical protein